MAALVEFRSPQFGNALVHEGAQAARHQTALRIDHLDRHRFGFEFFTGVSPDDVMFSPSVRAEQVRQGSRETYARRAAKGGFVAHLSAEAVAFIRGRNSAYLATASADGQPYVPHRGGPAGFIGVLDR